MKNLRSFTYSCFFHLFVYTVEVSKTVWSLIFFKTFLFVFCRIRKVSQVWNKMINYSFKFCVPVIFVCVSGILLCSFFLFGSSVSPPLPSVLRFHFSPHALLSVIMFLELWFNPVSSVSLLFLSSLTLFFIPRLCCPIRDIHFCSPEGLLVFARVWECFFFFFVCKLTITLSSSVEQDKVVWWVGYVCQLFSLSNTRNKNGFFFSLCS